MEILQLEEAEDAAARARRSLRLGHRCCPRFPAAAAIAVDDLRVRDPPSVVWLEINVGAMVGGLLAALAAVPIALVYEPRLAAVVWLTLVSVCSPARYDRAMAEGRLAGLVAVVVGAGQTPGDTIGNGRAIATTFAREGAEVLCVDRVAERAEETATSIRDRGGLAATFVADVTDDDQCAAVVAHSLANWGRIDVLVNVVGIGGRGDGPAHSADPSAFETIIDVNLTAMWRMCRSALPSMREHRRGSIVNVSSAASSAGGFQVAYEVSKAGVNRLTTSIAQSNASRGVRCNAIALGLVDTPMAVGGIAAARGVPVEQVRDERNRQVPLLGGMGTAWDAANAALFLASDEARFVTGVVLPVDGGTSIRIG